MCLGALKVANVRVQRQPKAKLLDVRWNARFGHDILRSRRVEFFAKNSPECCNRDWLLFVFCAEDRLTQHGVDQGLIAGTSAFGAGAKRFNDLVIEHDSDAGFARRGNDSTPFSFAEVVFVTHDIAPIRQEMLFGRK